MTTRNTGEETGGDSGDEIHSVGEILDMLRSLADRQDKVSIGNVLDTIGDRSYGPAMMLPAMIEISPVGGIPGVPTLLATIVALAAAQLLIGKEHLWLPQLVQKRAISAGKLHKAADKLDGLANWLDRWFHGRMPRFVTGIWPRIAAAIVILLCLTVPPLEFVPFASTAPMAAIIAFGLALLVRDGLLMLIALGVGVVSIGAGLGLAGNSGLLGGNSQ
ncbi:exopolysaccharide biosynthesis protein [Croceicoccus sp. YJ47]|uniref:exopolysaccharide biosynthesis protein n=1 Tax=Croceicoccus sp. YJ47 TaxID=2798724 RepID=UPI0019230E0F|nr:exopolysaccharide biosynthesis protein [Croceicoccus sp. YJ47]QQN75338.1 exopolysaccharide biosynthesis protein [Croceicoccus sp. YJ47]